MGPTITRLVSIQFKIKIALSFSIPYCSSTQGNHYNKLESSLKSRKVHNIEKWFSNFELRCPKLLYTHK